MVKATNSGSTDLVISIALTRGGMDILQESRTVRPGGSTSWTHGIDTQSQYHLTMTAAGSNGGEAYRSSGGFPTGNCNGADFVVNLDAYEVTDGGDTEGSSTGNCV